MKSIRYLFLSASVLLAACGGGDGGTAFTNNNGASGTTVVGTQLCPATSSSTVGSGVTVSGVARAQIVPDNQTTGTLTYSGQFYQSIRGATVELLDSATSAVLATATTDGTGAYSFLAPVNRSVKVRVKAQAVNTATTCPQYNISVRDNTSSDALYVLDSSVFNTGTSNQTINLSADSGWGTNSYTGTRASAPFAVLDTAYKAVLKIASVAPTVAVPKLNLYWSLNNVPTSGLLTLGQIGTSAFHGFDSVSASYQIYLLGRADVDTDEFDETVVAHEFGHFMQAAFSRDDSIGGTHSLGQKLDMRVAFSEGWGNAWSGMATARTVYTDSSGTSQASGFAVNLMTSGGTNRGWFNETSVQYLLGSLHQNSGFNAVWSAFTNSGFRTGPQVTSLHSFLAALDSTSRTTLSTYLTAESVVFVDAWGTGETNSGGLTGAAAALPIYKSYTVSNSTSYCLSNVNGTRNKLGNTQFIRVTLPSTKSYVISAASTAGTDPDFSVYQGGVVRNATAIGTTETATMSLSAGDAVIALTDYNQTAPCITLTIN